MEKITSLSVDLETYSDVELDKCGVYKYASSPAFVILLFGVSVNHGEVVVYDLASGETLPDEIIDALNDETVVKSAWNCAFERVCISRYLHEIGRFEDGYGDPDDTVGEYLNPVSWRDTALVSAYNSLPMSLKGAGEVLFPDEDSRKMEEGKELIRYFCKPCRPTKANGGRTRNLPGDAPEKWELFKRYNRRDVEVEMHIQERLGKYPVPEQVWQEFFVSEMINDRGVLVDREFVQQAVRMDGISRDSLVRRMRELTGLENPNSVAQVKAWLAENGQQVETLGKEDVQRMIGETDGAVQEVLELRLRAAKSSVKKYQAMLNAVCDDGRVRGMFRFYGANHTGRFVSKMIQLQNLRQNHLPDLDEARALVRGGDYDAVSMLYDDVPDTLSQLVRTSFIAWPGCKLIVSDYAAIEARVIAFIAGEKWRIEAFWEGKDIYCAAASQMFGVPVEKHGVNGLLRQRGKVAELACIAKDELVLTYRGLVPIQDVLMTDRLWDGGDCVTHEGVIDKGEGEVITYEGLTATWDHYVWVEGETEPVQFGVAASSGAHLVQTGDGRRAIRMGEDNQSREEMEQKLESLLCSDKMYRLWGSSMEKFEQPDFGEVERVSEVFTAKANPEMVGSKIDCCKTEMREPEQQRVSQLRRTRNQICVSKCYGSRAVSDQKVWDSRQDNGDRQDRQQWRLCTRESSLCSACSELCKSEKKRPEQIQSKVLALFKNGSGSKAVFWREQRRDYRGCEEGCEREEKELETHRRTTRLYDIRNAGRHHRFTVSGRLVHNCGYGGGVGALKAMGALENGMKEEELQPTVDAWRAASPHICRLWTDFGDAAKTVIRERRTVRTHGMVFSYRGGMMFITLPSGRQLVYARPRLEVGEFGRMEITYEGIGTTRKWERLRTWGGKITENIVQAFARDVLCYAMMNLRKYRIVMHIHDEVVVEAPEEITRIMGCTPPWAEGLLLRADGYECRAYRKD